MGWGRFLPVGVVLWASAAAAQAPWPTQQQQQAPWPGQQQPQGQAAASSQPQPQGQAPWPSQQQQPQGQAAWPSQQKQPQAQAAWPSQQAAGAPAAPPMMAPGIGAPPGMAGMGAPPGMTSPMGRGPAPPCAAVLTKLHAEAEKRGAEAKAGQARHASREEFCKLVTNLVAAEGKFTKTAEQEGHNCGIPPDAIKQMKAGHENLLKVKESVCSTAPTASGPPSLSEALGTDRLPLDDNEKTLVKRGGVLDSLTGTPIR